MRRTIDSDFEHMLALGLVGLGLADERRIVIERLGALSDWMPEKDQPLCSCAILFGMEEELASLVSAGDAPLTMPAVHLATLAQEQSG